jgi:hypothetical protein
MMDHCQIIRRNLLSKRAVDEETFASLAVLAERLERVKRLGNVFSNIEFSPDVERLKSRADAVPVG